MNIEEQVRAILRDNTVIADVNREGYIDVAATIDQQVQLFTQLITKEIKQAKISELKQLEPPEQYEDYARLMGSEHCKICGFNAIKFREHIENRINELNKD